MEMLTSGVLSKVPEWAQLISVAVTALVILATAIVRLTPSPKDDAAVSKAAKGIFKFLSFLPTIGINPNTKKLMDQYDGMKEKKK